MNAQEKIRSYLFTAGLDALADHVPVIEKAIHDFIAQLGTPMDVSNDALYRYEVPLISEDGSCSLIDEMDPVAYDLSRVLWVTAAISVLCVCFAYPLVLNADFQARFSEAAERKKEDQERRKRLARRRREERYYDD